MSAYVIGTGRTADRATATGFGVHEFVDLGTDDLAGIGQVDLVFDVIGGDIREQSVGLVRAGGTLVTVAGPPAAQPVDGRSVFFVVEPNREQLTRICQRVRQGRLRTNIGAVYPLDEAVQAFNSVPRPKGKTIIDIPG